MIDTNSALIFGFMSFLMIGLAILGHFTRAGIYFLAAIFPCIYLVLIIDQPFFRVFGILLIVWFFVLAFDLTSKIMGEEE